MVKTLHSAGGQRATTLVIFGWLFFVLSYVIENSFFVFVLRAAARVLPKSLVPEPTSRPLVRRPTRNTADRGGGWWRATASGCRSPGRALQEPGIGGRQSEGTRRPAAHCQAEGRPPGHRISN